MGRMIKCVLIVALTNISDFFNVPIIIHPEGLKLKYAGNAIRKAAVLKSMDKYNRTEEEYISDPLMKSTLAQTINDGKTQN